MFASPQKMPRLTELMVEKIDKEIRDFWHHQHELEIEKRRERERKWRLLRASKKKIFISRAATPLANTADPLSN